LEKLGGSLHIVGMNSFVMVLLGLAMAATVGVLIAGLVNFARKGGAGGVSGATSNKLMQARVIFQFAAIALFLLAFLISR
jgi:Hypoxia induced protein conserved region